MPFVFNGKTFNQPGAYGIMEVINSQGSPLPDFNIGVIIAGSDKGAPYTSSNKASEVILPYSNTNALIRDYGRGTIYKLFKRAKSPGAGTIFVLNASANTPASGTLMDSAGTPAKSVVVKAMPKNYGVFGNDAQISIVESASSDVLSGNASTGTASSATTVTLVDSLKSWTVDELKGKWIKIESGLGVGQTRKISANTATAVTVATWDVTPDTTSVYTIYEPQYTVTLTPTKDGRIIVKDVSSGDKFVWINDVDGLSIGATVDIYSNASSSKIGTYTIIGIDTNYNSTNKGYKVMFAEAINSANATKANFARFSGLDSDKSVSIIFSSSEYSLDNFVHQLNALQDEYKFEVADSATLPPAPISSTAISGLNTPTKGTNVSAGAGDYTNIAALFPDWQREFMTTNKVAMRLLLLGTPDTSVFAVFKALAIEMANNQNKKPIAVIAGSDFVTSNSDLIAKAKSLNKGMFCYCAGGIDGLPAYLSFAPQVFGIRLANSIVYKLTNVLIDCTKPEKEWTYDDLEVLQKNGVLTFHSTPTGYRVTQGITTYQDQTYQWNTNDNDTYLIRQRDLADYFHIGIINGLERDKIGIQDATKETLMTYSVSSAQGYIADGYITDYKIASIVSTNSGWVITHDLKLPEDKDYIGVVTRINI